MYNELKTKNKKKLKQTSTRKMKIIKSETQLKL